ncbi:unnamed protein product [Peniophora sp. CBMAI 1063]|nr:unnamed protein product [Peniophora sp. CBMAI 1063]
MSGMSDSSLPVVGPRRAARPHPLGKDLRLRIHLDGCRGLPQPETSTEGSAPRYFYVMVWSTSSQDSGDFATSSSVYEGTGYLQGTIRWDEILDITCFERSLVRITLYDDESNKICESGFPAGDLLQVSSVSLLPTSWTKFHCGTTQGCTLSISASTVPVDSEEQNRKLDNASSMVFERDDASSGLQLTARSWDVAFHGLASFGEAVLRANIARTGGNVYLAQHWTYRVYQTCSTRQSHDPRIDSLLDSLMTAVSQCAQVQATRVLQRKDCVEEIFGELCRLASDMDDIAGDPASDPATFCQDELARLVIILVTPDPPTGVSSTSPSADWAAIYGTVAKDALLFTLEGIVQSSDAFPPLKSAASGLLFFATSADMASSNKKHIRDIHKRVNGLTASLKRGAAEGSMLAPAHQDAISALAADISALKEDLESIVNERKNRFRRYFSAKRHREELQDIVWQLDNARSNYTTAVATLNATTNAQVLAHVRALTVVMGVNPMHLPGTRPVDAVSFPFGTSRFQEAALSSSNGASSFAIPRFITRWCEQNVNEEGGAMRRIVTRGVFKKDMQYSQEEHSSVRGSSGLARLFKPPRRI